MVNFAVHPFNIYTEQPELWKTIKILFVFTYIFSNIILLNFAFEKIIKIFNIFLNFLKKFKNSNKSNKFKAFHNLNSSYNSLNYQQSNKNTLFLKVGKKSNNEIIYIPEKGLYQNILITGTIGTGKTSSAMYPFTQQLLEYQAKSYKEKLGMLILDVKGNYYKQVYTYAKNCNRQKDLIIIDLSREN